MKVDPKIWILYLLTASLPFYCFSIFNIGSRGITAGWILSLVLIILFIFNFLVRKKRAIKASKVLFWVVLFNISAFVSLWGISNPSPERLTDFFTLWIQLLLTSALFFVILNLDIKWEKLTKVFKIWVVIAFITAGFGIYQGIARFLDLPYMLPLTNPSYGSLQRIGTYYSSPFLRTASFFGEPRWFGAFLISPLILLGITLLKKRGKSIFFKKNWINWLIFLVIGIGFFMSASLGAYVTAIGILLIMVISLQFSLFKKVLKIILLVSVSLTIASLSVSSNFFFPVLVNIAKIVKTPFLAVKGEPLPHVGSLYENVRDWKNVANFWYESPPLLAITGRGLNSLEIHGREWLGFSAARSGYHQILLDQGLIGLLIFLSMLGTMLWQLSYQARKTQNRSAQMTVVLLAFYFVIWADVIKLLYLGWVPLTRWFDFSIAALLLSKANELKTSYEDLANFN